MAFGGVEIGSDIAQEAATATPMRIVWVPPIEVNLSPIPEHTTVRIGMSRAAVAVFEIKLLSMKQTNPEITIITNGLNSANGMLFTAFSAKPVPFMARPSKTTGNHPDDGPIYIFQVAGCYHAGKGKNGNWKHSHSVGIDT